jgi:hypothetical protein
MRRLLYDENLGDQTTSNSNRRIARICDTDQQESGNRSMPSNRAVCSSMQYSGSSDCWQRADDEIQLRKSARIAGSTMASRSAIGPKDQTGTKKATVELDTGEQQCHVGLTADQPTSTSRKLGSYTDGQPTCKRHVYQKKGGQLDLQHGQTRVSTHTTTWVQPQLAVSKNSDSTQLFPMNRSVFSAETRRFQLVNRRMPIDMNVKVMPFGATNHQWRTMSETATHQGDGCNLNQPNTIQILVVS